MAMTKKDFELVSGAIASARFNSHYACEPTYQHALDMLTNELVGVLEQAFPRFDRVRFLSRAQIGKLPRKEEVNA